MKQITFSLLVGLLALCEQAFSQTGPQGDHPSYSGSKKMAIIMLAWSDKACPGTRKNVVDRMWNDDKSARNYYLRMSRGALDFALPADAVGGIVPASTSAVYGPYTLSVAEGYSEDITYANADDKFYGGFVSGSQVVARNLAAADGYNASNYDYIMYITPKSDSTGGLRGYAGFNATYSHNFEVSNRTINHELGHNLGMHHSNTGLNNGYASYDCIMANNKVPHLDGPHTYQMGWYSDDCWSLESYGQYDIENLAQPDTNNLKILRFDRNSHGATSNNSQNFWIEYRIQGVGEDSDLDGRWDKSVTVHQTEVSSRRPSDNWLNNLTNQMDSFQVRGSYTGSDNTCEIRFVRENASNASATVQIIDPDGNQPPNVTASQSFQVSLGTDSFTVLASDPENDSLTYSIISAPPAGMLNHSGNSFTYTALTVGVYTFVVRVNDGQYDSYDEIVTITVIGSTPPVVDAGQDQAVTYTPGQQWTPASMLTAAWYDAQDSNTIIHNSNAVSQWNDKSGNDHNAVQPNNTFKPVYIATDSVLGNRSSVGTGGLAAKFLSLPEFASKRIYSVMYYGNGSNTNWSEHNACMSGPGGSGQYRLTGSTNGSKWVTSNAFNDEGTYRDGSSTSSLNALPMPATQWRFDSSSSRSQIWKILCGNNNSYARWDGAIGELIFTDGGEDHDTQQKMEGYLAHKWGLTENLPLNHPYKTTPPGGGTFVTLNGTVSDLDGDALSSSWSKISGPGTVSFVNVASEDTIATFSDSGVYVLRLTSTDGLSTISDDVTITVGSSSSPYDTWAGGKPFNADSNGDGVSNGMAWLLGAADKDTNAITLLPLASEDTGSIVLNFICLKVAQRGNATLKVQASDDLGTTNFWTGDEAEVPDASGVVNGMTFVTSPHTNPALINVEVTVPCGLNGKVFLRIKGEQ